MIIIFNETAYFYVKNLRDKHDVKNIKNELGRLPGVSAVSVNKNTDKIAVDYDKTGIDKEKLQTKIKKMGYEIEDNNFESYIL